MPCPLRSRIISARDAEHYILATKQSVFPLSLPGRKAQRKEKNKKRRKREAPGIRRRKRIGIDLLLRRRSLSLSPSGGGSEADMADDKQSTSIPLTEHSSLGKTGGGGSSSSLQDPEDIDKSPPSSPNSSTRKVIPLDSSPEESFFLIVESIRFAWSQYVLLGRVPLSAKPRLGIGGGNLAVWCA